MYFELEVHMHEIYDRAAVDITPPLCRKALPPLPITETYWASRALETSFGRAIALRKRGKDLRVLILKPTDQAGCWYPAEAVLSNKQATQWVSSSTFTSRKR